MSASSFFKRNEKVIMVILLALIAPTFAFTGIIATVMEQDDPVVTTLFEEPVHQSEYFRVQNQLFEFGRIYQATIAGPIVFDERNRRFFQVNPDQVFDFMTMMKEAERLGIKASDAEVEEQIIDLGKKLIVHHQMMKNGQQLNLSSQDDQLAFQQKLTETAWTHGAYADALTAKNFCDTTPRVFESQLRDFLTVQTLNNLAAAAATVSEKEIWDQYCRERELRVFEFVRVPTERFLQEATDTLSEEDKRATFEKRQAQYRLRDRIRLEIVKRTFEGVEVSEDEITAYYEANKENQFVKKPASGDQPAEYFTVEERRAAIVQDVQEDKLKAAMADFLATSQTQQETVGDAFDLAGAVPPEDAHLYQVFETDPIARFEERQVDSRIRNDPVLQALMQAYASTKVGDLSSEPVVVPDGVYIYRVIEKLPSEPAQYETVGDRLVQDSIKDKKVKLANDFVAEWKTKIEEEEGTTLASFADAESYKVVVTDPIGRNESNKIRDGGNSVVGAWHIGQAGFGLTEIGSMADPVASVDSSEVYLVRWASRHDPSSADFANQKERIERTLLNEKRTELRDAYRESIMERAARRDPEPEKRDDAGDA